MEVVSVVYNMTIFVHTTGINCWKYPYEPGVLKFQ